MPRKRLFFEDGFPAGRPGLAASFGNIQTVCPKPGCGDRATWFGGSPGAVFWITFLGFIVCFIAGAKARRWHWPRRVRSASFDARGAFYYWMLYGY